MSEKTLPEGFENLETFVAYWAQPTNDKRWDQRARAPMPEIKAFYDAMYDRAEDAIAWLDEHYPLGQEMPTEANNLACLLLALGQAAIAVEMHRQPRSPFSAFPHAIHAKSGPWPLG